MVDRQSILSVGEKEGPGFERSEPGFRKMALRFMLHSALATIGGVLVGLLVLNFVPLRQVGPHWRLVRLFADFPYSPAFWGSALFLGFLANRRMRDRCACWVGPAGVFMLALLIALSIPGYEHSQYELEHTDHSFLKYIHGELFSLDPKKSVSDEGLGKVLFTTPVLNAVAYSVGAWVGLRSRRIVRVPGV